MHKNYIIEYFHSCKNKVNFDDIFDWKFRKNIEI